MLTIIMSSFQFANSISLWQKPLALPKPGSFAIGVLNQDDQGRAFPYQFALGDIGLTNVNGYNVTDVFENKPIGAFKLTQKIPLLIDPTCIVILKVVPL